jgi:hypothetical protein
MKAYDEIRPSFSREADIHTQSFQATMEPSRTGMLRYIDEALVFLLSGAQCITDLLRAVMRY